MTVRSFPLMRRLRKKTVVLAGCATVAFFSSACVTAQESLPNLASESPAIAAQASVPTPTKGFVTAANPLAVEAGLKILAQGGSAVDSAVAVQVVLGLAEPQSSGIGGGAFMAYFDAQSGTTTIYDGRETAPASATPELFYEDGQPLAFIDAVLSGRSTGVPGAIAMLHLAQSQHGTLPWSQLFAEGERLADDGFAVSSRLAGMMAGRNAQAHTPAARAYFTRPDGQTYQAGDILKNPAYADTLRRIAAEGPAGLLQGPVGEAIVKAVQEGPRPGGLTLEDMAQYQPIVREAVCGPYKVYVVCVPPPPSSGAAVLQLLAMAELTPDIDKGPNSPEAWVAFAQLQRLMYADRDRYYGDPAKVNVPISGLLDPAYVAERAAMAPGLTGKAPFGHPQGAPAVGEDATKEPTGTSHFVVTDAKGNVVSMTTTVESIFGSGRMAGGFFLNNQLTDFSMTPTAADGTPAANAVGPGKRPRSSMSPALIFDQQGRFIGAMGSPGGTSILAYNSKALIATLSWGMSVQDAFDLPNLVAKGDGFGADTERFSDELKAGMAERGIVIAPNATENSGLHGILWRNGQWDVGADNRREGVARFVD